MAIETPRGKIYPGKQSPFPQQPLLISRQSSAAKPKIKGKISLNFGFIFEAKCFFS
jgi:hypothetical protein